MSPILILQRFLVYVKLQELGCGKTPNGKQSGERQLVKKGLDEMWNLQCYKVKMG